MNAVFEQIFQVGFLAAIIRIATPLALATLGEMSAGMAHEIRNPLAALAGSMQILRKDLQSDESNRHLMDIAIRETSRLDSIITEFLLYARPPALNLKEYDVNVVLADTDGAFMKVKTVLYSA